LERFKGQVLGNMVDAARDRIRSQKGK
jgi:hypothetical protein